MVDISGLDKADVLAALYNASKAQGLGLLQFSPEPMTKEEANAELEKTKNWRYGSFDYLKGRVMKINISEDAFDPWGFDRDNGQGAAQAAIDNLTK